MLEKALQGWLIGSGALDLGLQRLEKAAGALVGDEPADILSNLLRTLRHLG